MKPQFLPVVLGGVRRSFTPARLFTSGVTGAWYDPSDYSTLFQDSAGMTPVTAVEQPVGRMLDKSGNNNHASQATSASRPVLRARYNQLTYSEDITNAAWLMLGSAGGSRSANVTTAPDGTLTADSYSVGTTTGAWYIANYAGPSLVSGISYTFSVYLKANGYNFVFIRPHNNTANFGASGFIVNLTDGVITYPSSPLAPATTGTATSVGNGWWRVTATSTANLTTAPAGGPAIWPRPNNSFSNASGTDGASFTGDGTSGAYIWGADFRTGSSVGTYQRIADATDYATAGFLPYLALDGTDDSMATGSINFTTTDKMSVCAGATKSSDASVAILVELSSTTNPGSFYISAPFGSSTSTYAFTSTGSTTNSQSVYGYAAPITNVLAMQTNIATPSLVARINGAQVVTNSTTQGTGNYGNYPLYIGRRNNASLPFNGRIYQMVVCGKTLSASELASTEAYVNSKTGAY